MSLTAIFDIGKTNKKCFVFDEQYRLVHQESVRLPETRDEDGFACEDLPGLTAWMQQSFQRLCKKYSIQKLNFSTYGASWVYLNQEKEVLGPLYNYLKDFPEDLHQQFFTRYGPESMWAQQTASPVLGMLNSGLQLYWLKHKRPEQFARLHTALHLPQYCSFLFGGERLSDFTSLGCHTGLWNFARNDYHSWVKQEQLTQKLAPLTYSGESQICQLHGKKIRMGVGLHDSSAALLPYLNRETEPFLLLSTGTWSICLNPFSKRLLSTAELQNDCLHYLQPNGKPVKAARLFLGEEYKIQTEFLARYYQKPLFFDHNLRFDQDLFSRSQTITTKCFRWEVFPILENEPLGTDLTALANYEHAYHRMMIELVDRQIQAIKLAQAETDIRRIFVDGGFRQNKVFLESLRQKLPAFSIFSSGFSNGAALGAAMSV